MSRSSVLAWADVSIYFYLLFLSKGYFTPYRRTETSYSNCSTLEQRVGFLLPSVDGLMPAGCEGLCTLKKDGKMLKGWGDQAGCAVRLLPVSLSFPCLKELAVHWACSAELRTISISGNARVCLFPQKDKKSSQPCPQAPQGGNLGTHSFEGHRNALTFTDFHACTS